MSKKTTILMILDGFGLNENPKGNAVAEAKKPHYDQMIKDWPSAPGNASGLFVGLPDGQMGNSEVGHLNIGAGRIVYQDLTKITKSIQDGDFFENPALLDAVKNCKENDSFPTAAYTAISSMCTVFWNLPSATAFRKYMCMDLWTDGTRLLLRASSM